MKIINFFAISILLVSCGTLPQFYQSVEDVADDTAIKVLVSREAIQKQTDVNISIDVKNNIPTTK